MSKFYLVVLSEQETHKILTSGTKRFSVNHPLLLSLQLNDMLLFVRSTKKENILPYVGKVTYVNRAAGTVTIEIEDEMYNTVVPAEKLIEIIQPQIVPKWGLQEISATQFASLIGHMGGKTMEEKDLLDYIRNYILARGYYFDEETLTNYHICLKTRPFVILAGLSGTGKSKLTQLYAEAMGHKAHYQRTAVRPNWNDDRYLLGYFNTLTDDYVTEPAVEFILNAGDDEDNLYFFCLDEMNLAHVEYYFSQFLSALEEEQPEDRLIPLVGSRTQKRLEKQGQVLSVPTDLLLPVNLLFTGTINVDETTQPISDKVIDRANTLEFFNVELDKIPERDDTPLDPLPISALAWMSYKASKPDSSYRSQVIEISKILNKADIGLGYRVLHEIEMYLANSATLLEPDVAFDLQVKQRILPRLRGSEVIKNMLIELATFLKQNKLPRSEKRLEEMRNRLERDGYTSFWR